MIKVVSVLLKKKLNNMKNSTLKGVSIIIPTYNEEKVIIKTLENIRRYVKIKKEVIIIDDSTDKTESIVKQYIRNHHWVIFIKNKPQNKGFVQSVFTGVKMSSKELVVMVMGDMCDNPQTINIMYRKISEGWDVVCGSRYMRGGKRLGGPEFLGFLSQYLCLSSYILTGIPTHDITNSFKMYRKQLLQKLKFNYDAGTAISMEILYQAYFNNAKITEVPTVWRGRLETRFKLGQRGPKYLKIFYWALKNKLRQLLKLLLNEFYLKT